MSCDDVCITMDLDGSAEFYREATRRAAKPHKCCECGDVIAKGDLYHYASGKCDGDFYTAHTCAACDEIRDAFICDGVVFYVLWESVREQLFPYWDEMKAIDCLAKLESPAAIEKMRAKYAEYQKDRS